MSEKTMYIKVNGVKMEVHQYTPKIPNAAENCGWKGYVQGEDGYTYSLKIYPNQNEGIRKTGKKDSALKSEIDALRAEVAGLKAPKSNGKPKGKLAPLASVDDDE